MRRYELSAPINNVIPGGGFRSGIIDVLELNYSVARNDSYTLVQRYRRVRSTESVADLGRSKIIMAEYSIDDDVLAKYVEVQNSGTKVFLVNASDVDNSIEVANANGLEGVVCLSDSDVENARAVGLKALVSHSFAGITSADFCEVNVDNIVDEESAALLIAATTGKGELIAMGDPDLSETTYARAMTIGAKYFGSVDEFNESPFWSAPKILMGTEVQSFDEVGDDWVFKTDIGTVTTDSDGSRWLVRNELGRVVEHYVLSNVDLKVETSPNKQDITDGRIQTQDYSPEMILDRYVRFSSEDEDADSSLRVVVSNDIDTIKHSTTYDMLEPLPGWMAWRTDDQSLAWRFTNAIGAVVDELKNFPSGIVLSGVQSFPANEVNGFGTKTMVGRDYWPTNPDTAQAQDIKQLLMSTQPCFCILDEWIVTVGPDETDTNLWTPLDEWGLMFDLDRHHGEGLTRFRSRIMDVMAHRIGSSEEGIKAAAVRELSPFVDDEFVAYDGTEDMSVVSLDDPSMLNDNGMPTDILNRAVEAQRKMGVHTWDNAVIGESVWNADGIDHIGGDHLPNRFDTDLSSFPSRMIASGSGPEQDMAIIKKGDTERSTVVNLTKKWFELADLNLVHPAVVKFNTWCQGTYWRADRPIVTYRLKVKIRRTSDSKEFYRYIDNSTRSNYDPNIKVRNSSIEAHRLFSASGYPVGTWNQVTDNKVVPRTQLPKLSQINRITSEVVAIKTTLNGVTTARTTTSQQGNERYIRMTMNASPNPSEIWTSSGSTLTLNSPGAGDHTLFVQVAPYNGDGHKTQVAWTSKKASTEVTVNDAMSSGNYVVTPKTVPFPKIYVPSYITGKTYTTQLVSVSFPMRSDATDAELTTANASASIVINGGANPTSITVGACNAGQDPPLRVPVAVSSTGSVLTDSLGIGRTEKFNISEFNLTVPPTTWVNVLDENFNRADSTNIGPVLTEFTGQWSVTNNRLSITLTANADGIAVFDTGSVNQRVSAKLVTVGQMRLLCRYADENNHYFVVAVAGNRLELYRKKDNQNLFLDDYWTALDGTKNTEIRCEGNKIEVYYDDQEEPCINVTNSELVSGTKAGVRALGGGTGGTFTFDDLKAYVATDKGTAFGEMYSTVVDPGFLASVDSANDIVNVTRERIPSDSELLVNPGFHWLGQQEDYFYTAKQTTPVAAGQTSIVLSDEPADFSLVKADPFIYRFAVDQNGAKTFDVTEEITGSGTTTLVIPDADVTGVLVELNGNPVSVDSVSENKVTLSSASTLGAIYDVSYRLAESFFVDGKTVHLSSSDQVLNIEWQSNTAGAVSSGVNVDPLMTWNRRFFVGLEANIDRSAKNVSILNPRPVSINSSSSSLHQWVMIPIEVTDADGNPLPGETISFIVSDGVLSEDTAVTNDEGIAVAYFSAIDVLTSSVEFTASSENPVSSDTVDVVVNSTSADDDWILTVDHPSMVKAGTQAEVAWKQTPTDGVALTKTTYRIDYIPFSDNGTLTTNAVVDTDLDTYSLSNIDANGNVLWTEVVPDTNGTNPVGKFSVSVTRESRYGSLLSTGLYKMTITAKTGADVAKKSKTIIWRVY